MLRRTIAALALALCQAALAQPAGGNPDPKHALEGEALVKALRAGGYTLYFRHAERDRTGVPGPRMLCLVGSGKAQARSIGESMKALGIPIGEALASPMCRTMETAEGIAGRAPTPEESIRDPKAGNLEGDFTKIGRLMAAPPAAGTNRIVVGHFNAWDVLFGAPVLQEAEGAVLKPEGGKLFVVARLRAEDWKALANPANRPPIEQRTSLPDPDLKLSGGALADALKAGGFTIFFRHSITDHSQKDRPPFVAKDCATQRNLSAEGREAARKIGEVFKTLKLPVTEVLSSPYCRTMQTARLITGEAREDDAVRGRAPVAGGRADYSRLEALLATPVKTGLRVIVSHGNGLMDTAGLPEPEEGEATVIRAVEGGGWIIVARLKIDDWAALVAAPNPAPNPNAKP
ncbi:hypothetical protein DSM104443_00667 [Usitatibacter rugosus]|uniref:Histidine phosphatase family protein n=1 Tax=Usitatibacter rugosus TaxID=2732067 RepID=A0A6M4GS26_9PROT|nr:histidine phosphatase family protein [Usitatibacter rugosus]QJR09618.1 hypothetical protein DSM104443_00667 [Usitatibacter rugosus]